MRRPSRSLPSLVAMLFVCGTSLHANEAPVVTVNLPLDGLVRSGDRIQVRIDVVDPDGDPLTIRAVEPPLGFVFAPRVQVPSPFTFTVDWSVAEVRNAEGAITIVADDGSELTTAAAPYRALDGASALRRVHLGDVTGDGVDDVVAYSQYGVYPTSDGPFGGVFVWRGGAGLPTNAPAISLHPASNFSTFAPGTQMAGLHDVTGDGVLDIVLLLTNLARPLQVWRGGADLATGMAPTATVDAIPAAFLNESICFGDVTGDGIDDMLALAGGSLYVWAGGPSIDARPTARLFVPVAPMGGNVGLGSSLTILVDVTGDGVLDVVASGSGASFGGRDGGAIYLWHGGAELSGSRAPSATLLQPWGPRDFDTVALGSSGFHVGDVTGDGIVDVFDRAYEDVYLWRGGPHLIGRRTAELWLRDVRDPLASTGIVELDGDGRADFLGGGTYTRPFWSDIGTKVGLPDPDGTVVVPPDMGFTPQTPSHHLADVDGDGQMDLLALDPAAEHPVTGDGNAGAIHIWYGGIGFGAASAPDATLVSPLPVVSTRIGKNVSVAEVTGDAYLDVIAGADGTVHVWEGGPTRFSGVVESIAELLGTGQNVRVADVTGDGAAEVLTYDPTFLGIFHAFEGGPGLSGQPTPAISVADRDGSYGFLEPDVADLDGDDVLDLFVGSPFLTVAEQDRAGAIDVWRGGTLSATPDLTIRRIVPVVRDELGVTPPTAIRDVTGDGLVDLVYGGRDIDVGGVANVGAILLLSGFGLPVELFVPGAAAGARLGGG